MNEQIEEQIKSGDKILMFVGQFPIDTIPKIKPIRIEKLNSKERDMYKKKIAYVNEWQEWGGINKFLVETLGEWYLVRIYES